MSLLNTPRFLYTHPLCAQDRLGALRRYVGWQVGSRLVRGPVVCDFVNGTQLVVKRGMTGATGNVYAGLHEFEDMAFVLHLLRPGDRFVDVGANVGAYTVLAASVGAACEAFEPGAEAFAALELNLAVNTFPHPVRAHRAAVGRVAGTLAFTTGLDTVNHVASDDEAAQTVSLPVVALDEVIPPGTGTVVKMDVEGYETEVVAGAAEVLSRSETRAVLMELNGSGDRYGFDEEVLRSKMEAFGFTPCSYKPFERALVPFTEGTSGNTLFVTDRAWVQARLREAPPFRVLGRSI